MRARLPLRLARSAAFTVVCVSLAVLGHRAAGGSGPASWAVAGGAATVTALATLIAGRERSPQTVIGFLVGTQVFLHLLFGASGGAGTALRVHLGHGQSLGADVGMAIAHLTATLIAGWWLARGESALWSVLRRLGTLAVRRARRLLTLLERATPAPRRPRPGAAGHVAPAPVRRELRHCVRRRGPPLPAAF
ncbi:MFS transporter [Sphaerisporangium album]|uniref:MFS transporter n=1 Tax=Sphaerisporangium album TaxID=509200 RepID=A0A367FUL6_9ACTN|nr:MFS transporter [Sphaerisporangium album]RCG33400.1 MFS transporter [Sphaerisporangium album]